MDEPHRHRALAHRGSDSLDRATAHVTSGEYARQTRLQKIRFSRKSLPNGNLKRRTLQRPARQDEAAFVEFDAPWSQPVLASAPMKTKRDRAPRVRRVSERLSPTTSPSRRSSPTSSRISVFASSSTFPGFMIRLTR